MEGKCWRSKKDKHTEVSTSGSVSRPSTRLLSVCTSTKHCGGKKKPSKKTIETCNQESPERRSRPCIFAERQKTKQLAWNEMFDIETNCQSACIYCHIKIIQKKPKTLNVSFIGLGSRVNINLFIFKVEISGMITQLGI